MTKERKRDLTIVVLVAVIVALLGIIVWSITDGTEEEDKSPEYQPVVVGQVYLDSAYQGTPGALDDWDTPATDCHAILRYAGSSGTVELEGEEGAGSTWSFSTSQGRIVDEAEVKNGVYQLEVSWAPEGIFTEDSDIESQGVNLVLYEVEVLTEVGKYTSQKLIGSNIVEVTEDGPNIIQGPIILLTSASSSYYGPLG